MFSGRSVRKGSVRVKLKNDMKKIHIQNHEEILKKIDRYTEVPMLVLVVIMIITLVLPMVVSVNEFTAHFLEIVDWVIWGAFALELAVKTYIAEKKLAYLKKNWVDVVIVAVPLLRVFRVFRIARLARGARAVRSTRFLRILRVGRIVVFFTKFTTEIKKFLSRHGFNYVFVLFLGLVGLGTILIHSFDQGAAEGADTLDKSLWLVVVSAFSGGFANIYPSTPEAKALSVFLIVVGTVLVSYFTASLASYFTEKEQDVEQERIEKKLDQLLRGIKSLQKKNNK